MAKTAKIAVPPGTPLTDEEREVVEKNTPLVIWVAAFREFDSFRLPMDDRIQAGSIGLGRAVQLFDPDLGFELSTYAVPHIRQAIYVAERGESLIHVPAWIRGGTEPRTPKQAKHVEAAAAVRSVDSLDALESPVAAGRGSHVEDAERADETRAAAKALHAAMACLDRRERDVLESLALDGETLKRIGERYGICRERVRQIGDAAILRLRLHPALAPFAKGA